MEAALRWLADHTPGSAELLRLMDGTPVPCGQSTVTARRSDLFGYAGYGYCSSHSRFYWGAKLMLITTADGTVTGFGLASPKLMGERDQTRQMFEHAPASRPPARHDDRGRQGFVGADFEEFLVGLELTLVRPARRDERDPGIFPNWLRQRIEAIIWTLVTSSPGTPRQPGARRPVGPHRPAPAGPQRCDLAQLGHRRIRQALPDRL